MREGEKQVSKLALSVQIKAGGKGRERREEGDWERVRRVMSERRRAGRQER